MSTAVAPTKSDAQALIAPQEKKNLYTLFYRSGSNPHPQVKNFFCEGTIREVIDRAKKHCEIIACRFVRVQPFISNLNADERLHRGEPQDAD